MKWKITVGKAILILCITMVWASVPAQTMPTKKTEKADTLENQSKMTCYINGNKVSQRAFKLFLSKLEQIAETWQCVKTKGGGITSYDAKDKNGVIYHYEIRQEVIDGLPENEQSLTLVKNSDLNLKR
jgi:hypothetical protein